MIKKEENMVDLVGLHPKPSPRGEGVLHSKTDEVEFYDKNKRKLW